MAGGGPAGLGAAISAARMGSKVILLEADHRSLGGMGTIGQMCSFAYPLDEECGLPQEILNTLRENRWDPKGLSLILLNLATGAGVDVRFGAKVVAPITRDNTVLGVRYQKGDKEFDILGARVVDATGRGRLLIQAGGRFVTGREGYIEFKESLAPTTGDHYVQGVTAVGIIKDYGRLNGPHRLPEPDEYNPSRYERFILNGSSNYWKLRWYPLGDGRLLLNHLHKFAPRGYPLSDTEIQDLAMEARRDLLGFIYFIQNEIRRNQTGTLTGMPTWGLDNIWGTEDATAPYFGIRETIRLWNPRMLTENDMLAGIISEDAVAVCSAPPDIHVCNESEELVNGDWVYSYGWPQDKMHLFRRNGGLYGIPYRNLLPAGIENLIVPSPSGCTHVAFSATRMMANVMRAGQAAGVACHLSISQNVPLSKVRPAEIREILVSKMKVRISRRGLEGKWYDAAMQEMTARGIMVDFRSGDSLIKRAEMCSVCLSALKQEIMQGLTSPFTDTVNHWASKEIATAAGKGWVNGYPDHTFLPDNPLTRAEFTKVICKSLEISPTTPSAAVFPDVPPSHWAAPYIFTCKQKGIIRGNADGLFRPGDPLTRGQIAQIFLNLIKNDIIPTGSLPPLEQVQSGYLDQPSTQQQDHNPIDQPQG